MPRIRVNSKIYMMIRKKSPRTGLMKMLLVWAKSRKKI
jgi:hypothetical protein